MPEYFSTSRTRRCRVEESRKSLPEMKRREIFKKKKKKNQKKMKDRPTTILEELAAENLSIGGGVQQDSVRVDTTRVSRYNR